MKANVSNTRERQTVHVILSMELGTMRCWKKMLAVPDVFDEKGDVQCLVIVTRTSNGRNEPGA